MVFMAVTQDPANYHPLLPLIRLPSYKALPLAPCCVVCGPHVVQSQPLSKCSRCKVVSYCGRDHQKEDYANHKRKCRHIQQCTIECERLEKELPAELFTENVGHFWLMLETRPFMKAKRNLMLALTVTMTHAGVSSALHQGLDCLRLCRADNQGIRDAIPALMLQLGKLQECYDFIKWYATSDPDGRYDWADMSLPFLSVKNADMTEKVLDDFDKWSSVFHLAALTYIKLKLAVQARDAIQAQAVVEKASLPGHIGGVLQTMLAPITPVVGKNKPSSLQQLEKLEKKLKLQAAAAFYLVHKHNEHYWACVMDPRSLRDHRSPGYFREGDHFEVQNWLVPHSLLWAQEPLAAAFIAENMKMF